MPYGFRSVPGNRVYQDIYEAVGQIPHGHVATYGQLAQLVGLPAHARMVGWALHVLPEGHPAPWYRVVNARGMISLENRGEGARLQRSLLEAEGVHFDEEGRIDLERYRWRPPGWIDTPRRSGRSTRTEP